MSATFVDIPKRVYYYWNDFLKTKDLSLGYSYHQDGKYYSVDANVGVDLAISPAGKICTKILAHLDMTSTVVGAAATVITVASMTSLPIAGPVLACTAWAKGGVSGYTSVRASCALYDRSQNKQSISFRDRESRGCYTSILASAIGLSTSAATSSTLSAVENSHVIGKIANAAVTALQGSALVMKGVGMINSLENLVQKHREDELTALDVAQFSASLLLFSNTTREVFNRIGESSDFATSYPYFSTVLSIVQQLALKEMLKDFPEMYQHIILQLSECLFSVMNDTSGIGYLKVVHFICDYVKSSLFLCFASHSKYMLEILRDRIRKLPPEEMENSKLCLAVLEQFLLKPEALFDIFWCVKSFYCRLVDSTPLFWIEESVNYLELASVANILLQMNRFQAQSIIECDQKMLNAFGFKKISSLTANILALYSYIEDAVIAVDRNIDDNDDNKATGKCDSSCGIYDDYNKYCFKVMELLYDSKIIKSLSKKIYQNKIVCSENQSSDHPVSYTDVDRNIDNNDDYKDTDEGGSKCGIYDDYSKYCFKVVELLYDGKIIKSLAKKIYQNKIGCSENQSCDDPVSNTDTDKITVSFEGKTVF